MLTNYNITIDTREKIPLQFKDSITKTMNVGDYSGEINGIQLPVCFDRKSPNDAFGTLVQGHERFKREIERAKEQGIKLIMIVECSYTDFINKRFKGAKFSQIPITTLTKIVHSTMLSHDLEIVFCQDRKEMTKYINNYLETLKNRELKYNREKYGLMAL